MIGTFTCLAPRTVTRRSPHNALLICFHCSNLQFMRFLVCLLAFLELSATLLQINCYSQPIVKLGNQLVYALDLCISYRGGFWVEWFPTMTI